MRSITRLNPGTRIAGIHNGRAASSHFPRVPLGRAGAVTSPGLSFLRRPRARAPSAATPPQSYPADLTSQRAWRNPTGTPESGISPARPQSRFCSETHAQQLTLRAGPGLPHHRHHPLTVDEAIAGILTLSICGASLAYALWRLI
jgi:hypothetical protein